MTSSVVMRRRSAGIVNLAYLNADTAESVKIRQAVRRGRFDECDRMIRSTEDPNDRFHMVEACADWKSEASWLDRWRQSGSLIGRTAYWIHRLKQGWELTPWTHGRVDLAAFHAILDEAKRDLVAIAKESGRDATAIPWLMWVARASRDHAFARKLFTEGVRCEPRLRALYTGALYTESAAWHGSSEECLRFAREWSEKAPRGIGAPALLVEARWFDVPSNAVFAFEQKKYWSLPEVAADVREADDRCRAEGFWGTNGWRTHQLLAFALWRAGDAAQAKPHFEAAGKTGNEFPWQSVRTGLNWLFYEYPKARKKCLKAG
jgi:hypothetical protein